ncbi:hypothetical protein BCON_0031g00410 [Botryotinia convoluta]|uniref:Cytochrome P450 n=1 Tax=Botryotinia convoluta TaxID=54673 RepID=A0A4Z1IVY7_9HELO|nr:hypothetical protein BCON_0031g00410 [Botryotinia convoluta]
MAVFLYLLIRGIYNLYFHPLSKYPGPKLAAVSNIWYAYNWLTGKWPWKIEEMLKHYGDVVRIAPNELLFLTPQAGKDVHATQVKNLETFVKTDFEDLGEDGGISFEIDPVKYRDVAKKLSPAFSARNTKAKEAVLHKYIDFFVDKMKAVGGEKGVELQKSSLLSNAVIRVNLYLTIQAVSKKFPFLSPLMYLFIPPSVWLTMPRVLKINSQEVHSRIECRGKTEHLDYFEQLIPRDALAPQDQKQINHLKQIAGQLLVAGWEPMSNQFYSSIFFLLKVPSAYKSLVSEIRSNFKNYNEITPDSVANMKYLHACLQETFRIHQNTSDGLPRMSPGAIVDGNYIPRGRWLLSSYSEYDDKYQNDDPKAFLPFNQGPRTCPASAIAWAQMKLYIAKVLWTFDVEAVPGQDLSFDRDFSVYTMWNKPQFWVRFVPVKSEEGR